MPAERQWFSRPNAAQCVLLASCRLRPRLLPRGHLLDLPLLGFGDLLREPLHLAQGPGPKLGGRHLDRPSMSPAISMACWWCGIMPCTKATSAWLGWELAGSPESLSAALPQAASSPMAATTGAMRRIVGVLLKMFDKSDLVLATDSSPGHAELHWCSCPWEAAVMAWRRCLDR